MFFIAILMAWAYSAPILPCAGSLYQHYVSPVQDMMLYKHHDETTNSKMVYDHTSRVKNTYDHRSAQSVQHEGTSVYQVSSVYREPIAEVKTEALTHVTAPHDAYAEQQVASYASCVKHLPHEFPVIPQQPAIIQASHDRHIHNEGCSYNSDFESMRRWADAQTYQQCVAYTKKSHEAHGFIRHIDTLFNQFNKQLEQATNLSDYQKAYGTLLAIDNTITQIDKIKPLAYVLSCPTYHTVKHIQSPLLDLFLDDKNALTKRDMTQMAWALHGYYKQMGRIFNRQISLPAGQLKNIVDSYYNSPWWSRAIQSIAYYGVKGYRDLMIASKLERYQKMLDRQRLEQSPVAVESKTTVARTNYQQLHDQTAQQCATHKQGILADYYQSREQALHKMLQGDTGIYERTYELSPQAQTIMQKHSIDASQFATCTGNLVQQDTHAKLVRSLNTLAQKAPKTEATKQIQEGALLCTQAGNQFNQNGQLQEAMQIADLCHVTIEYLWQGIEVGAALSKGIAKGVQAGLLSEIRSAAIDLGLRASPETLLTAGNGMEPNFEERVMTETASIIGDLCRLMKSSAEVAANGVAGAADAVVGFPKSIGDCIDVVKLTGTAIGHFSMLTVLAIDAGDRNDLVAAKYYFDAMHDSCGQLVQGISAYLTHLEGCRPNGPITKQDAKDLARLAGRFVADGILFGKAREGITQIIKGAATYIKAAEPIIAELKNVKELSRAQVRNIFLSAQLSMKSPLEGLPRVNTIVQQIGSSSMTSELKLPVLSQAVKEQFASAIAKQANQPLTRLLAQRLGKFLSFEAKPGYIELPAIRGIKANSNVQDYLIACRNGFKIDLSKLDLRNIPIHLYDQTIGDLNKLQALVDQFKDVPGAIGDDGPLKRILELGYKGADPGKIRTAKGAFYELEVATTLEASGERVIGFDIAYKGAGSSKEFDVIIKDKLIECKNVDWSILIGNKAGDFKSKIGAQAKIAYILNKELILCSKQPIPVDWQIWFNEKNIHTMIG